MNPSAANAVSTAAASVKTSVERGLNDTRLAVLGIIVGIALAVGFGVATWSITAGIVACVAAFVAASAVIKWRRSRHWMMAFVHWLTDR